VSKDSKLSKLLETCDAATLGGTREIVNGVSCITFPRSGTPEHEAIREAQHNFRAAFDVATVRKLIEVASCAAGLSDQLCPHDGIDHFGVAKLQAALAKVGGLGE